MSVTSHKPIPVSIQKKSEKEMQIAWNNGEFTTISFIDLRFHCRCAECVDEWTRQRKIQREKIPWDIKPVGVQTVGRYAIQVDWSDGHRAGIYPFELLYELAIEANRKAEIS